MPLTYPKLGIGSVKFGRNSKVKYPESFEIPSQEAIEKILNTCRSMGIYLIDTAPAYGLAEERIGIALANDRQNWILGSKVGEDFVNGNSYFNFGSEAAMISIERSFDRLKTRYLDYMLIHSDGDDEASLCSGALEVLERFKNRGMIGEIGASIKSSAGAKLLMNMKLDLCMIDLNIENQSNITYCQRLIDSGAKVLIKKSLGSGHIEASKALRWLSAQNCFTSIIIGSLNIEHISQYHSSIRDK